MEGKLYGSSIRRQRWWPGQDGKITDTERGEIKVLFGYFFFLKKK